MKLIRRSMAKLLRDRMLKLDWPEIELFPGHDKFGNTSDIYAPFDPSYCASARQEIERITDQIEALAPRAFTGVAPEAAERDPSPPPLKPLPQRGKNGGRGKD